MSNLLSEPTFGSTSEIICPDGHSACKAASMATEAPSPVSPILPTPLTSRRGAGVLKWRGCAFRCGRCPCCKVPTFLWDPSATSFHSPWRMARLPSCSQKIARGKRLASERRNEAYTFHGRDGMSVKIGGIFAPDNSTKVAIRSIRWPGCFSSSPARPDACRPMSNQRRGNAAFMHKMLVFAKRRIADVCPVSAIGDVGIGRFRASRPDLREPAWHRALSGRLVIWM